MGSIALMERCREWGGMLGKLARSLCSRECRRIGKAANGRKRYELAIGIPVTVVIEYKPRRPRRDTALTTALDRGDGPAIVDAVHTMTEAADAGCLLWSRDDVKGFGRFRYRGKDLRVYRVVAQALWGDVPDIVRQTCGNKLCCAPEHQMVEP